MVYRINMFFLSQLTFIHTPMQNKIYISKHKHKRHYNILNKEFQRTRKRKIVEK